MIFYVNGDYCSHEPTIDSHDRGFLLGDGVFETILIKNKCPLFLQAHLQRLHKACEALLIPYAPVIEDIIDVINALIEKNIVQQDMIAARITVTRGGGPRGLLFPKVEIIKPTVMISLSPMGTPKDQFQFCVSSYKRGENLVSARHKTLNYLENIMARNEAARAGYDEAILCNHAGAVACGSYSNIFLITERHDVLTPPVEDGALPGIVRAVVQDLCAQHDISCQEASVTVQQLNQCSVFFTNSLIGLVRATPQEHDVFKVLSSAYDKEMQKEIDNFSNLCGTQS